MAEEASRKKAMDIETVLGEDVAHHNTTLLECVHLVHNAVPEMDFSEISTATTFLGRRFSAPIMADSMTGGSQISLDVNRTIAEVVEELGLGMGLGSQKVGILHPELAESFSIARKHAPNAFIAANIGGAQLVRGFGLPEVEKALGMAGADALIVHLNPMQEVVQVGGEPQYKGVLEKIGELVKSLKVPVIVKEVGFGISTEAATKLEMAGVAAINVAGAGGTSWAAVEHYKATAKGSEEEAELGRLFWDWGIPTSASIMQVRRAVRIPIIASGGIRNGLEVAKCLAVGANICGLARPVLEAATKGKDFLRSYMLHTINELEAAMFGVGARDIEAVSKARYVITGSLRDWVAGPGLGR